MPIVRATGGDLRTVYVRPCYAHRTVENDVALAIAIAASDVDFELGPAGNPVHACYAARW
ncbi:MAG: hypothetical protein CMJ64_16150 [Planctomycetaceae bacterium]|nr:hypothetical protein [Planctomycetaceae bacterium]